MKHRNVDFDVEEVQPGRWRWSIFPETEGGPKAVGQPKYKTRELAVEAAIEEINNAFERARRAPRRFRT
jgi:hypothetical protein